MKNELLQHEYERFYYRMRILGGVLLAMSAVLMTMILMLSDNPTTRQLLLIAVALPGATSLISLMVPKGRALSLMATINIMLGVIALTVVNLRSPTLVGTTWALYLIWPLLAAVVLPRLRVVLAITVLNFLSLLTIPTLRFSQVIATNFAVDTEVMARDWTVVLLAMILTTSAVLTMSIAERRAAARTFATLKQQQDSNATLAATLKDSQHTNQQIRKLIEAQSSLQTLVHELSAPIITLNDVFALLTLNGPLDEDFLRRLERAIPEQVHQRGFDQLVLDLTGTTLLDSAGIQRLRALVRKVELLGCRVFISGINPSMAPAIAREDDDLLADRVVQLHDILQHWVSSLQAA